ncbi:DEAD/DEAH box helicase [Peribacillus frigoritolerans]
MAAFDKLLLELRESSSDYRTMGDKFERLMVEYLKTDPLYKDKFNNIWMWKDFPHNEGKVDTGIDIIAEEVETGKYCAIQCKFYDENHILQKKDIDSFFTASGKSIYSSRIIVTTTDKWSKHAEDALKGQTIPVARIRLADLSKSAIDWEQFSLAKPSEMKLAKKKQLRPHQQEALTKVMAGLKEDDRGKLVMACGTGKTFTSLKIGEAFANENIEHTYVLYLVPSISLLSQTLREWNNDTEIPFNTFAVCSDKKVTKQSEDITAVDLGFPATTDPHKLVEQFKRSNTNKKMTVVFSTYQSIEVISKAQEIGLVEFDLIISDEAHRTTGVTLAGEDESHFTRVHNNSFIKAKKRLYQTATPKIFADETKSKAGEKNAVLCSMDDESIFGKELHYLGFGEAVSLGLLTDYKVMVLAVSEDYVHKAFVNELKDENNELQLSDVVKITGCWNGLSKRKSHSAEKFGPPMKRAVAFSKSIKDSKLITDMFAHIVDEHIRLNDEQDGLVCEVEHVDGSFNALERNKKIDWLKDETSENTCRILSNARCLTEGVDVPDLDAVMFLNPRNSVVDVVQAVGRVMRKAEGKDYGYIILPIGIPTDMTAEVALNDNKKYKVVWQVLQALRAHDERFNTMVNQIELNKKKPNKVGVYGIGGSEGGNGTEEGGSTQVSFNFPDLEDLRDAVYAKLVEKVGDRRYWENWATDVAKIAQIFIERIGLMLNQASKSDLNKFESFLQELRNNINEDIERQEAIEMIAQHLITKPVFDALFEKYSFIANNPVSMAMEKVLEIFGKESLSNEVKSLEKFYESVRERAKGIDNAAGKQKIIIELYDKFFKIAFSKTTSKLGIVYTPVEVVDFMIQSAQDILSKEFGMHLSDEGIHILDPFTGTGTFINRVIQSNLINPRDLLRKYTNELHANEIILLAYYIAAINIEEAFHEKWEGEYVPFEGIILTDTFNMYEGNTFDGELFPENNSRIMKQKDNDITVIIGNPPYKAKQESENEDNKNQKYHLLDQSIRDTYVKFSKATNKNNLYDSYIRAIKWASDRLQDKGLLCFITNGSFLDGTAMDGLRKCLHEDFNTIYCLNLRGNARNVGELRKKEGGNVFGAGTQTSIAITIMVKNPDIHEHKIFYYEADDYLTKEQKLEFLRNKKSFKNITWKEIIPNADNDWINQRIEGFDKFIPIASKKNEGIYLFELFNRGYETSRDAWVYNFSQKNLVESVKKLEVNYNIEVEKFANHLKSGADWESFEFEIENDTRKIKWSSSLKNDLKRQKKLTFDDSKLRKAMYRPFCKQWLYFDKDFIHRPGKWDSFFPNNYSENKVIYINGPGTGKSTSALMVNVIPDLNLQHSGGQGFPLYVYNESGTTLFDEKERYYNINPRAVAIFKKRFNQEITEQGIFYYIYAILNHHVYLESFKTNMQKELPRIPFTNDFAKTARYGKLLSEIHLNYEELEEYSVKEVWKEDFEHTYEFKKMKFVKNKKVDDKTKIIVNDVLTLEEIPLDCYLYQINGRSAIEWFIDQYTVTEDNATGIIKDPFEMYSAEYLIGLLKKIITLSMETIKIQKEMDNEIKIIKLETT